jgi:long-chain fatty acid transport protein
MTFTGLGTKARSMGGAFIGLADDYSAIYWNPAGLALLQGSGVGLSLDAALPTATYRQQAFSPGQGSVPLIDARSVRKSYLSGLAAGWCALGPRWTLGLGVYSPTVYGIEWSGAAMTALTDGDPSVRWSSGVSVITVAAAAACKLDERVYVGASIGLNSGRFKVARYAGTFRAPLPEPPYEEDVPLGQYEESLTGWGFSASLGMLFRPNDRISVGISFKMPSSITFQGVARIAGFPDLSAVIERQISGSSAIDKKITWPMELGAGIAYRPMDRLTLTADIQWTRWSDLDIIQTNYHDISWKTYMAERGNDRMPMYIQNSVRIKTGVEYAWKNIALRAGACLDPSPAPGDTINLLFPSKNSYGLSLGAGYIFKNWRADVGLEYQATRSAAATLRMMPVYPPSTRTTWDFQWPGTFDRSAVTLSFALCYKL